MPGRPLRILGVGSGRSIHLLRWARHLAERGHEVHLLSDRPADPAELDGVASSRDVRSLELATRVPGLRVARFGPAIGRLARRLEVDVLHAHSLLPYGYWGALAGVHPLVVSPWGTDALVHARERPRGRRAAVAALAAADLVLVNSQALEDASVELGAEPGRIRRVYWHLDLARFGPGRADPGLRARFGWPEDALVVLSLRNFRPDTNLDVLVRAFARVAREEPRARLLLAARSGPLRGEIETLVAQLGLAPRVAFHRAAIDELPVLVAAGDVAVSLTRSDSTPPSLLEAMASGLPVVAAEAASLDEWIGPGDGADVVPAPEADAVAGALLGLLRDPERRRRYGERNARVARERVADPGPALEALYRELARR